MAKIGLFFLLTTLVLVGSYLTDFAALAEPKYFEETIEIHGSALKWFVVAEPELHKKNIHAENYTMYLYEENDVMLVHFSAKSHVPGYKDLSVEHPDFTVEISKKDMCVLKAYYNRYKS